jgi:hypothetical protein
MVDLSTPQQNQHVKAFTPFYLSFWVVSSRFFTWTSDCLPLTGTAMLFETKMAPEVVAVWWFFRPTANIAEKSPPIDKILLGSSPLGMN